MQFPVLNHKAGLTSVPWGLLEPHEKQAVKNHYQSLKRLAERGGLSVTEMYYILRDERFPIHGWVSIEFAAQYVATRVALYLQNPIDTPPVTQ